ncbi:MAG: hypothetical protein Q8O67_20805 [Deltaproteobacteria bacterium]|nr:hypothetical protein [Deltaproteobacteria bacterium]
MNAPLPVDFVLPSSPCPACAASLMMDPRKPTPCPHCAAVVGSPRRFVDDAGRRLIVRPAFSSGPLRACGRCKQSLQRVLVDDVAGCFCGSCNMVFIGARNAPRLPVADVDRLQVDSEAGPTRVKARDAVAVAAAVVAIATVAFIELGMFL